MKVDKLYKFIFARDFFKDRTVVFLLLMFTAITIVNILVIVFGVDASSPFERLRYNGFDLERDAFERGKGYQQYSLGLFSLATYLITAALSIKTFNLRKSLSSAQLALGMVVAIMSFFVFRALLITS